MLKTATIAMLLLPLLLLANPVLAGDGSGEYLQGLDLLEAGKFSDAATQFENAIEQNDENPTYRIALGAALTLGEKLPEAEKVLARATKLSGNDEEARLWMATAIAMQGDFQRGTEYYPFAVARNEYVNEIRRMSHEYGQAAFAMETARRNGNNKWDLDYAKQQLANRDNLRKAFPRLGTAFSHKMKAKLPAGRQRISVDNADQQKISDALMARIKQNIDKPDYAAALRDINPLLAGNAKDLQLLLYHGICTLNLGAPGIARRQLTRALYNWPLQGDLYAMRAVAAARTGDQRRAGLDLRTAQSLGSGRAAWAMKEIAAAPRATGDPAAMLDQMSASAQGGESFGALVDQATRLVLVQNANRRRLDEDYTDGLREHQGGVNANPRDASKLADFAAFLYDNAVSPRGEAVELRASWRPYRPVDDAMLQAELTRALNIANEALAVDGGNVSAMITKAAVLVNRMQLGDAEQFLKQALSLAPTEPRLLRLFAEVADRAAVAKQAQANALRAPTTWEDQFYIYTRYPSAAELAQADALEAQANRLWAMARQALQQAVAQSKSRADAAYFQAVLDRREGQVDAALAWARKAVELEPANLQYMDLVTTLLAQTGQKVEALLNQAHATNLVHSTAGPGLKCVWFSLPRTKFKTSRDYLARAAT
ncbi:MAG: tetratricopeptide repeat protein, partial [Tepidisphaeraceae bacterium]